MALTMDRIAAAATGVLILGVPACAPEPEPPAPVQVESSQDDRRITVRTGETTSEIDLTPLFDALKDLSERQLPEVQRQIEDYAASDAPKLGESLAGAMAALGALGEGLADGALRGDRPYVWISPPAQPGDVAQVRVIQLDGQTPTDVTVDESRNGRKQVIRMTSESGQTTTITVETSRD